jgi:hypothetical protein
VALRAARLIQRRAVLSESRASNSEGRTRNEKRPARFHRFGQYIRLKPTRIAHPGGAATVHANHAMSGLIPLESLALVTGAQQQTLMAAAVDLVILVGTRPMSLST